MIKVKFGRKEECIYWEITRNGLVIDMTEDL